MLSSRYRTISPSKNQSHRASVFNYLGYFLLNDLVVTVMRFRFLSFFSPEAGAALDSAGASSGTGTDRAEMVSRENRNRERTMVSCDLQR